MSIKAESWRIWSKQRTKGIVVVGVVELPSSWGRGAYHHHPHPHLHYYSLLLRTMVLGESGADSDSDNELVIVVAVGAAGDEILPVARVVFELEPVVGSRMRTSSCEDHDPPRSP